VPAHAHSAGVAASTAASAAAIASTARATSTSPGARFAGSTLAGFAAAAAEVALPVGATTAAGQRCRRLARSPAGVAAAGLLPPGLLALRQRRNDTPTRPDAISTAAAAVRAMAVLSWVRSSAAVIMQADLELLWLVPAATAAKTGQPPVWHQHT
jgi:hypothetical protein